MKILQNKYKNNFSAWRTLANKNSVLQHLKKITFPKLDEKLAEFVGIYLGDGTITPYLIRISGDARYDWEYFLYISELVKRLFNIDSKIVRDQNNSLSLFIRSKNICSFLKKNTELNSEIKLETKHAFLRKF